MLRYDPRLQRSPLLQPVDPSDVGQADLVAFLDSRTGGQAGLS